jgi:hypothetical protein
MAGWEKEIQQAVRHFWATRGHQAQRQGTGTNVDKGARAAVTGGAQMDEFIDLFARLAEEAGASPKAIFRKRAIELPGFFRPTKEWDLLVVHKGQLVLAVETKSQVGPSFGNNFNNRTEEAIGSALDLWTAFREGAFRSTIQPWLGYLFLLEDCPGSQSPVKVKEPHFKVFPEFQGASYAKRYELFCRKLIRERHYSAACFLTSGASQGLQGAFTEPASDLRIHDFINAFLAHITLRTT